MKRSFLFACFLLLAWAVAGHAAPALQPGFRTLGVWEPDKGLRLDLAIWYPAKRSPFQVEYGDWSFRAARNALPVPGRHPLVMLSHDSAGSRFSLHQLGAALARNGFVAVAPTHPGDNIDDMSALFTPAHLRQRARDIKAAIDVLLANSGTEPMVDPQRIGVLGVGPGGTTALLLAGGRLDPAGWADYCAKSKLARQATGTEDPFPAESLYCTPWAARQIRRLAEDPALDENHRDTRIRVATAVAPWYGMFFSKQSLSRIRIPIMLMNAEKDSGNPAIFHVDAIRKALPQPPDYVVLENADPAALLSSCSSTLAETWPELCLGATEERRQQVQEELTEGASRFFLSHLATPNPPPLPPEATEEATEAAPAGQPVGQTGQKPEPARNSRPARRSK